MDLFHSLGILIYSISHSSVYLLIQVEALICLLSEIFHLLMIPFAEAKRIAVLFSYPDPFQHRHLLPSSLLGVSALSS